MASNAVVKFAHMDERKLPAYEVVRQASGLSVQQMPDAMIEAIWSFVGSQVDTPYEMAVFLAVARRHGLDPLMKEIFAFKADGKVQVWSGRDGFLKAAGRQENYQGHRLGVVYPGEPFRIELQGDDVFVFHEMNGFPKPFVLNDPSTHPLGGYCIAYGKGRRPVVIRRLFTDYRYLWSNSKKYNWARHPIDMFENRLLAGGLRRIIAIGDLSIEGEDWESSREYTEERVGTTTGQKLRDLRTRLEGVGVQAEAPEELEAEVLTEEEIKAARLKQYQQLFEETRKQKGLPPLAVLAWAKSTASLPENLKEWTEDNLVFAMQAIAEAEGRDVWVEYGRWLAGKAGLHGGDMITVENDLLNAPDVEALKQLIARLEERVPSQERVWS